MRVLLAIDGSGPSALGIDLVASIAWPSDTMITIVTALPDDVDVFGGPWPGAAMIQAPEIRERLEADIRTELRAAADRLAQPGLVIDTRLLRGRAATQLLAEAARERADLIVLGARGHGTLDRMLLGSVSAEVVGHAPCPVLVARGRSIHGGLVATDASPSAIGAAAMIGKDGFLAGVEARVISVVDVPIPWWTGMAADASWVASAYVDAREASRRDVATEAERATEQLRANGLKTSVVTREGDAAQEILAEAAAWGAELIVVGSRRQGAITRGLLGSVSRNVLEHASVSVLVGGGPSHQTG
jgi:nucleotide-binding universal stress UspA family protein